jgi:dipeptidyl aminopeptidase/acylaminoacyl peptidase
LIVLAAVLALAAQARAAQPAPPPTDAYGGLPQIELMTLSPSGAALAYVVVTGDQRQVVVKDLAGTALYAAAVGDNKVRGLAWAGDGHLLVEATATLHTWWAKYELGQTMAVDLKTGKTVALFRNEAAVLHATLGYAGSAQIDGHWYGFAYGEALTKTRGFNATFDDDSVINLYRVDLDTGATKLVGPGRAGRPRRWVIDAQGAIVAFSEYDQAGGLWTLTPGGEGGIALVSQKDPLGEIELEGLGRAPGTVIVDKPLPEEWSLMGGGHTPLIDDLDGQSVDYLHDPTSRRLIGVRLDGERIEQRFYDPALQARATALAKALKTPIRIVSWSADFKRLILYTEGDGDAGTFWLVDGKAVRPYAYSYPELPDASLGPTRVVSYKAGDGLDIHGVLTLPPGRQAKGLPLVVMPHGGPEAHDNAGVFDWWAQAFASRGYAVFQPNFRGSSGYGVDFRDAGFGQWGRKMQTDISDGVAELAREGVIDPKRACIVGASYGGYAALAGVTVQTGLYRCAVSYGGLSDLNYLLNEESGGGDDRNAGMRYMHKFLGVADNDAAVLHGLSPARLAERADAPILLLHATDDTVVPIGQSREMERRLRQAGKPVAFVEIKGEDHWLSRDASRKAVLAASVDFVEKNDPPD